MIPTYTISGDLEILAAKCAKSLREADEIIICEDGGTFSEMLKNESDCYIFNRKNVGFSANVNRGWKMATGDFVMIVNSDIEKISGNLSDLCVEGKVTSPKIENQRIEGLAGCFFVVPRKVFEQRGMLLEQLRTYCSDEEYGHRTKDIFQKIESVTVSHARSQTMEAAKVDQTRETDRDKQIYEQLIEKGQAAH